MTATTIARPIPARSGLSDTYRRLNRLTDNGSNLAQWWVDMAAQLDELSMRLYTEGESRWRGLKDQLTHDAPHITPSVVRIDHETDELFDEVHRVRVLTGQSAGDPARVRPVRDAVKSLLHRLRRLEERTTDTLYDAYERDLGGESA